MSSRSLTAVSKVLFAKVLDNENEAAARLSLPPTSKILKLERLRHAAGEAFALETCYLSAAEFSGLLDAPIGRESLFGILERNYNIGTWLCRRRD
jgi:GntR family transcriptional regulator